VHIILESVFQHVLWVLLVMLPVVFFIVITSSEWKWHWCSHVGSFIESWNNFGGVEEWVKVVVDFSIVSEHLEDIFFVDTVSFKIEVEIEIIIHFKWFECWSIFRLFVHPELVWVHVEVNGCFVLLLH